MLILEKYRNIYQFVYGTIFSKSYTMNIKRGVNEKSNFLYLFKLKKDKKLFQRYHFKQNANVEENGPFTEK